MVNIKLKPCVSPYPFSDIPLRKDLYHNIDGLIISNLKYRYNLQTYNFVLPRLVRWLRFF